MANIANITADGETTINFNGGSVMAGFSGTFGGGTITASVSLDGSADFIPLGISATAPALAAVPALGPCVLKFVMASSTTPNVSIHLV